MKKIIITLLALMSLTVVWAQRPGGPRSGGGPEVMIAREKQAVFEKITTLTEDQKLLLDGIYDEFTTTLKETFEANRNAGGDRETMRAKMQAVRKEKNDLIKDVLNGDQFTIYKNITQRRRARRETPPSQD